MAGPEGLNHPTARPGGFVNAENGIGMPAAGQAKLSG